VWLKAHRQLLKLMMYLSVAKIIGQSRSRRLTSGLRVRGDLNAQIRHSRLRVGCQAIKDLLPATDEVQLRGVCKPFFRDHCGIGWKGLITG
jgi:hypothetical protein